MPWFYKLIRAKYIHFSLSKQQNLWHDCLILKKNTLIYSSFPFVTLLKTFRSDKKYLQYDWSLNITLASNVERNVVFFFYKHFYHACKRLLIIKVHDLIFRKYDTTQMVYFKFQISRAFDWFDVNIIIHLPIKCCSRIFFSFLRSML